MYWLPKRIVVDIILRNFEPNVLSVSHSQRSGKTVFLTFDDAPRSSCKEIVKILDEFNVKATFFIIASQVNDDESMELLTDMVRNGHHLTNHGHTSTMHIMSSDAGLTTEISMCDDLITRIYSKAAVDRPAFRFFRPGHGYFNTRMITLCKKLGYRIALGSVYPHDAHVPLWFINFYYLIWHVDDNDVIILHDRKWTVPLLRRFLRWLRDNKFQTFTLKDV